MFHVKRFTMNAIFTALLVTGMLVVLDAKPLFQHYVLGASWANTN